MANSKKRMTLRMGIVTGAQVIEDNGVVSEDYIINTWGGAYYRLEPEEAVMFQAALNEACGDDLDALTKKARAVGVKFGLDMIGGEPAKPARPAR